MLKLTLITIVIIAALFYIAETKITFSPFKVQFARGWFALGWIFIAIGVGLIMYQSHKDGVRDGINKTMNYFMKASKKEK